MCEYLIFNTNAFFINELFDQVNETLVLLFQLVLDWQFEPTTEINSYKDVKYEQKTLIVPIMPKMNFVARN